MAVGYALIVFWGSTVESIVVCGSKTHQQSQMLSPSGKEKFPRVFEGLNVSCIIEGVDNLIRVSRDYLINVKGDFDWEMIR